MSLKTGMAVPSDTALMFEASRGINKGDIYDLRSQSGAIVAKSHNTISSLMLHVSSATT